MNKISNLKNNSNVEQIASELFELIKQKDKNILNDLYHFEDNVVEKIISISKEMVSKNFDNEFFMNKKIQLESPYQDISKFTQVFDLLDKKLDNEIKHNDSLSKTEKEDLQQEFLFMIRQKHSDFFAVKKQCENILSFIEERLTDLNQVSKKSSLLEKIKGTKNNVPDNNNNNLKNKF